MHSLSEFQSKIYRFFFICLILDLFATHLFLQQMNKNQIKNQLQRKSFTYTPNPTNVNAKKKTTKSRLHRHDKTITNYIQI